MARIHAGPAPIREAFRLTRRRGCSRPGRGSRPYRRRLPQAGAAYSGRRAAGFRNCSSSSGRSPPAAPAETTTASIMPAPEPARSLSPGTSGSSPVQRTVLPASGRRASRSISRRIASATARRPAASRRTAGSADFAGASTSQVTAAISCHSRSRASQPSTRCRMRIRQRLKARAVPPRAPLHSP